MQRVLSIQSHVAFGHVGNRAAVFPLQRMGIDALAINTVEFSNHTGYGAWRGMVLPPEHITELVLGLDALGVLAACDAVLSGYAGEAALGEAVLDAVRRVRSHRPGALYCCDPVMGDVGRGFFVKPGIPEFMRDRALPAADIATPNQFELEFLTERKVTDLASALAATEAARALGPKLVLLTSLVRSDGPADRIEMLLDTPDGAYLTATPRLDLTPPPNGAGDCVAALFLGRLLQAGNPAAALEHATAAIYAVFAATKAAGTRELALIAAQDELAWPTQSFPLTRIRG